VVPSQNIEDYPHCINGPYEVNAVPLEIGKEEEHE
jgi:hypothetical protein